MIIRAEICVCSVCGNRWLPQPTKDNPDADPHRVRRCARCKSMHWNDDDPKVRARKEAPRPLTPKQREQAQKTIRQQREIAKQAPKPAVKLCRHRIEADKCPLCKGKV